MSSKEKAGRFVYSRRQIIVVTLPVILATFVVAFMLVPPETLGYWADAYTVALIATLFIIFVIGFNLRQS